MAMLNEAQSFFIQNICFGSKICCFNKCICNAAKRGENHDHLRIVTLPSARDLSDAIDRLGNFLASYRQ